MSITLKSRLGRVTIAIAVFALVVTSLFALPLVTQSSDVYAADVAYTGAWEGNDNPTPLQEDYDPSGVEPYSGVSKAQNWLPKSYAWPYPWSRNEEATGNWIADSYGLSAADAALFEPVTVDRLADVIGVEDGRYYVVFATPRSKAGQKLIKAINVAAKAANAATSGSVKKIYVFNPLIDDYQIDITLTDGIGNWTGNNSHTIKGTWTYIKGLLANGGVVTGDGLTKGDNVYDFSTYTPEKAVIFSTTQDTSGNSGSDALNTTRTISAAADEDASGAASYNKTDAADSTLVDEITAVFKNNTASYVADTAVRTDFDFARKFWNAGINDFNYNGGTPSDAKFGRNDLNVFPTAAEYSNLPAIDKANVGTYTASTFPLEFIDFVEGYNRLNYALNSKTWLNYFIATIGCHNSQAYISEFAKKGVKYNQKVYINDDTLDGSFRFGTTVATKDAKNGVTDYGSTASGWLSARNTYNFSYLYGHTIEYLGDKVISKNETYKNNSIPYYYDGEYTDESTKTVVRKSFSGYDAGTLASKPAGNAVRLQIPFTIAFNGATALTETGYTPVTPATQFLHRKVTDDGRYSEYMMETTSVWGSPESVAATSTQTTDEVDGYPTGTGAEPGGASAYAQAGRDYPLESVFLRYRLAEPTDLYSNAPVPSFTGTAKPGQSVTLNTALWEKPRFTQVASVVFIPDTTANVTKTSTTETTVEDGDATLPYVIASESNLLPSAADKTTEFSGTITLKAGSYTAGSIDPSKYTIDGNGGYNADLVTATATSSSSGGTHIRITIKLTKDDYATTNHIVTWKLDGKAVKSGPINTENSTYTIPADAGSKKLTVAVTGTSSILNNVYTHSVVKESTAVSIAKGTLKSATPTISGTAKVGKVLIAKTGTWESAATLTYQWYAGGKAISGATKSKFTPKVAQLGKAITVKVTGEKTGYTKKSITSKATAKVVSDFTKSATPKINGTAKVGKKLTATVGTWSPKPTFKYQWYANGKAIKGAAKATYTLKKAEKGKKITVKITATKTNYVKTAKTSKATGKVK
jgi:hypothetical protein